VNLAELLDWSVALIPVLFMAILFAWLDVFKLMSPWEMIACLLLGMVAALAAWPLSGQMLDTQPIGYSF
jgi:F0F1-type ATP synthase assembly protein I